MASEMLKKALIVSAEEEYFNIESLCPAVNWEPSEVFCMRMDELLKQTQKRRFFNVKKVLLVAAVIFLIGVTTVFSFASVRENVINFFREYYHTHFELEYGHNEAGDIREGEGIRDVYEFSYLPEGFKEVSINRNDHSVITVFEKENGDAIILSQGDGITKRNVDVERLEKSEIVSDSTVYEVYTEENYIFIMWNTEKYTFSIDYFGKLTPQEIVDLAEKLKGEEK
ncbi:MAG: DUF4367 domain-containing protein [Clostridia bacterium]|nr:DUF4367 domain-containing protein [Clostridia bacterium]